MDEDFQKQICKGQSFKDFEWLESVMCSDKSLLH